jgi:hypothetical protein
MKFILVCAGLALHGSLAFAQSGGGGGGGSSPTLNNAVGNLGNTNTGVTAPSSNSSVQPGASR